MLRYAIGKISVKNAKRFDKKMALVVDFALFFRYVAVRYGALETSDNNGLPTLFKCLVQLSF
jgi:hypothetical protein